MKKLLVALMVVGGVALAPNAAVAKPEPCPPGWFLQFVGSGDLFDKNGNGIICTKDIAGDGDGNSANSQRGGGQTGFHADGHNHRDDRVS